MATIIIKVDDKQAIAALRQLNDSIDKTGKKAEKSFDKAGLSIGATAGIVGALSTEFIQLAKVAVTAFLDITKGAINLNKEAELTRLSLIAIFEGNEKAAAAFIDTIGDLAIKLGTSRTELTALAKGILPDVGGIEATAELLENVIVLGRDAGKNIDSIRIATEEALSGNLKSLGLRLNIPGKTLRSIREYNKSMSLADAINKGLKERIIDSGISAEVTADSFTTLEGEIRGQFETLQRELGVAPFEELKEQAQAFLELFEEKGPEITRVAQAFGDLAANVIEFVGTNLISFIEGIDFEGVEKLVDGFNDAVDAGKLLLDVFFDLDDATPFNSLIAGLTKVVEKLKEAAIAGAQLGAIVEAKAARDTAEALKAAELSGFGIETPEGKRIAPFLVKGFLTVAENAEIAAAGQDAFNAVMNESLEAFEDLDEAQEKSTKRTEDRRKVVKDTTAADIAAGEAVLANKKALAELADAQAAAGKAQEEISKKTAEFEEDQAERLTKFLKKEVDRRIDDELKAAQQRENIALNNTQAIESIFLRNRQAIADVDLTAEEEEIALKGARERRDIERNSANERLNIERNFRQELKRIRDQFNQDAEDAERNNDAQAFLRASRARDRQVDEAKISRDESLIGVDVRAKEQRAELKIQLKNEVEDARSANAEKLASLQNRLDQELERQALKNKQELERQDIKEQQLAERRDAAFIRDIAALEQAELEKQAKLTESLSKQLAAIEAAKTKETEVTAQAEAQKTAIVEAEVAKRRTALAAQAAAQEQAGAGAVPLAPTRRDLGALTPFQLGGRPPVGRPIKVGEAGPEIFVPDSAGTIIPNNAIFSPPAQPSPLTQMSSSVTNNSPTFNLAESMFQDPIARRNLTNFVLGVLAERV